jgi:hypothetical protein
MSTLASAPKSQSTAIVPFKRTPKFITERIRFPDDDEICEIYNPYAVLGLPPDLPSSLDQILDDGNARRRWKQQIENAYLELMRQYHPDVMLRKGRMYVLKNRALVICDRLLFY